MTLNFQDWLNESQEYDQALANYQAKEPSYLQNPTIRQELETTGNITIRTLMKLGLSEGDANFASRELTKRYGNQEKRYTYQKSQEPPTTDDHYYHVTLKRNLPSIRKYGLVPGSEPTFSNYKDYTAKKVFLCELGAINYWKERVAIQFSHDVKLVVLKIPKTTVTKVLSDTRGTDDSYQPAYYTQETIPPQNIKIVKKNKK